MDSIQIKNLRAFEDTGEIKLKPLNIVVGKNSIGKSTLLRVYPLFKQSMQTRISDPLLWYGEYVDFGDYKTSINRNNMNDGIEFRFKFKIQESRTKEKDMIEEIDLSFVLDNDKIKNILLKIEDNEIEINIQKNKVKLLRINSERFEKGTSLHRLYNDILPYLVNDQNKIYHPLVSIFEKNQYINELLHELRLDVSDEENEYSEAIERNIIFYDGKFSKSKIIDTLNKVKEIKGEEKEEKIIALFIMAHINNIMDIINSYLRSYFLNSNYIAPIRATAERYYRVQGLYTEEIDPRGSNVPIILKNMNDKEKEKFEGWTKEKFGFYIKTTSTEGHISLAIQKDKFQEEVNMADVGFGYSQIIPIIIMLWFEKNRRKRYYRGNRIGRRHEYVVGRTIVIEQPELHLHPKFQSELLDTIIEVASAPELDGKLKVILETHSEHIVNYIGELIHQKKIKKEDVAILIIETDKDEKTGVTTTGYDDKGYLIKWPLDFFE